MIHIHATKKMLNTSRLVAPLHITVPATGQMLHSWYCDLLPTGFSGKLLTMYVHESSLLTIVCKGKTLKGTLPEFRGRLAQLLNRLDLANSFVEFETALADEYVISKTNSRSMLSYMRQIKWQLGDICCEYESYEDINPDKLEGAMTDYIYQDPNKKGAYITVMDYWKKMGRL